MEMRLGQIVSNLLILLFNSLFVDAEKFISRVRFFTRTIFRSREEEEKVLEKSPSKIQTQEFEEMGKVVDRLGIMWGLEGIIGNSSADVAAVFEEEEPSLDEIKEAFRIFDGNSDGFIDGGDLHRIISDLGLKERHDLGECDRMIRAVDCDGDGLIDFQEFVKFMETCLC